jgi:alkaline phosphatase D
MMLALFWITRAEGVGVFFGNGIKIGEVDAHSAIVWTRLTAWPRPGESDGAGAVAVIGRRLAQTPVPDRPGALPGSGGEVQVEYRQQGVERWETAPWRPVRAEHDNTLQVRLEGLEPATNYVVRVTARPAADAPISDRMTGRFRTAPAPEVPFPVRFTVVTGFEFKDADLEGLGFRIHPAMLKLHPDFIVPTGDNVYYDHGAAWAQNLEEARWFWHRMFGLPSAVEFYRRVPAYFMKDDHDTLCDDCWPAMKTKRMGTLTFHEGQQIFRDEVPMGERTWRTTRWGKDLQIWLVEGRDFRDPNPMPDGPGKTIWGAEQITWFKRTVEASDAAFRLLISPTPLVGPDRKNKRDSYANTAFASEGRGLRQFIAGQRGMYVICGDRHWQYISVDPATGLREYSCGPASDEHAGGWDPQDVRPEHHYLNVTGGFLSVTVERRDRLPTITFRHHGVDGSVLHEEVRTATKK